MNTLDVHKKSRREALRAQREREDRTEIVRKRVRLATTVMACVLVTALVAFGLWNARPESRATSEAAPDFTLQTTAGSTVTLSDYRGRPVLLYFNEGAGCGACTEQMAAIEKDPGFTRAGIAVLPIVMNTAAQIEPDLKQYGVTTPYLLDDGTVSKEYDALGKGMHENLPGHGFVLINAKGDQVWQGNYPSMWIAPTDLLKKVNAEI